MSKRLINLDESSRSQSNQKAANIRWSEKRKAQEQQIQEQEYTEQLENDRDSLTPLQQIEQRLRRIENELALT